MLGAALTAPASAAPFVSAAGGNIFLTDGVGHSKQLTYTGHDAGPVLSPDGRWAIFVRTIPGKTIPTGSDYRGQPTELWQIDANGKNATLLVRCRASEKMDNVIAGFGKTQFSSDGRYVFFTTPAWATSDAVHVVDTTNGREHFVCPGTDLEVLPSGQYRDCLLVRQHRYFLGGGSFDWYWLLRPDGQELGPVGDDPGNFKELYLKE
jgi:dipeptidyl aminopeptidase/acylaminoacyl peptidase